MRYFLFFFSLIILSFSSFGQEDSSLYVKLRFHLIKNFEFKNDSISRLLKSEIYFLVLYSNNNKPDSFSIWQSGNNSSYEKLKSCVQKTFNEIRDIKLRKSIIVPVLIYNIDEKTWKDIKSKELLEYLAKEQVAGFKAVNEEITIFKKIVITQMARPDNRRSY